MGFAATAALFLFHAPEPHVPSVARAACNPRSRGANEFHRCRGGVQYWSQRGKALYTAQKNIK